MDWPGFSVTENVPPTIEKPLPVMEAELIVAGAVPLEVTVIDFVTAVPTETLPNASELALKLRAGFAAFNWSTTLFEDAFAVADRVIVCDVLTEATFALNDAEDAPAANIALAGTVTELLLLARLALSPPDGAAEVSVTVHEVVAAPVNVLVAQDSPLTVGATGDEEPLKLIEVVFETVPSFAVSTTVCKADTADTDAVKFPVDEPDAIVMDDGTLTAALLLARATATPPFGAGALNVTVQESVPAAMSDALAQLRPLSEAVEELEPLPWSFTALCTTALVLVIAETLS